MLQVADRLYESLADRRVEARAELHELDRSLARTREYLLDEGDLAIHQWEMKPRRSQETRERVEVTQE